MRDQTYTNLTGVLFVICLAMAIVFALTECANAADNRVPENCRSKQYYDGIQQAQSGAQKYYENNSLELEPYKCKFCTGYHLTKKDPAK